MKNILWISLSILLLMNSCSDEVEQIDTEIEFPETTELITGNVTGEIVDLQGLTVDEVTVDLLVDGSVVGTRKTVNGAYDFVDQGLHPERTVIRAHSSTKAASYKRLSINEGESAVVDFVLDDYVMISSRSTNAFNIENSDGFRAEFVDNYISDQETVWVGYRGYSLPVDENLLSLKTGVDINGDLISLEIEQAYYVGAYGADRESILKKVDEAYTVTLPRAIGTTLWAFDVTSGLWNQISDVTESGNSMIFEAEDFTYFATVGLGANCTQDMEAPIAVCIANFDLDLGVSNSIHSSQIDNGSHDNCDDDLRILIQKDTDVCNANPGFSYQKFFCNEEIGEVITCSMIAMDDAGNTDECAFTVTVTGEIDCPGDMTKPIPFCLNDIPVELQNGTATLLAEAIDVGSFDNCTRTLDFQVKKETDVCGNGSDDFSPQIEFCQAEENQVIIVQLLVTDMNGNSDYCRTSVSVGG